MRRIATFFLDTLYDIFGLFFILLILAIMAGTLFWRLSVLFSL